MLPLVVLLALACSDATKPDGSDDSGSAGDGGHGSGECEIVPEAEDFQGELFATSGYCEDCHSNSETAEAMRDGSGADIAMVDLWQATMMANAARDPLFRAVVSVESTTHAELGDAIQDICLTCHAPMARTEKQLLGEGGLVLDDIQTAGDLADLGLDGVSCTVCHQIQPDNLGTEESFSGGYVVEDVGEIYGPHDDLHANPMEMHTGYTPVQADHVQESALCATCHTLTTDTLEDGAPTGHRLVEQAPYLEWLSSSWSEGTTCQDCHVPTVEADGHAISTRIARNPEGNDFGSISDRSPYGKHRFIGGNTLVPAMLRDNPEVLQPRASAEAFDSTIAAVQQQLGERSASLELVSSTRSAGQVELTVAVGNLTGHKLPTGHPSRRVWLQLRAIDGSGSEVFALGQVDDEGRILGSDGAPLASEAAGGPVHPHRDRVDDADAPQIWQSLMQTVDGEPTFALLSGASYVKDDRLLPAGWAPTSDVLEAVAPVGTDDDDSFAGGGDQLTVSFPAEGAVTVELALVYQPVSPRYVAELATHTTPEVSTFLTLWETADRSPETLASATVEVP